MKSLHAFFIIGLSFLFVAPKPAQADVSGFPFPNLIVCNGPDCNFGHLMLLFRNISQLIIILACLASIYLVAKAGVLIGSAAGNVKQKQRGQSILWRTVIGLICVFAAYFIIASIMSVVDDKYRTIGV